MLTAKEKAIEILEQYNRICVAEAEAAALDMAAWFKRYLETRRDEYLASINTQKDLYEYDYGYVDAINECIDKLF